MDLPNAAESAIMGSVESPDSEGTPTQGAGIARAYLRHSGDFCGALGGLFRGSCQFYRRARCIHPVVAPYFVRSRVVQYIGGSASSGHGVDSLWLTGALSLGAAAGRLDCLYHFLRWCGGNS